jgi:hypothetical protein
MADFRTAVKVSFQRAKLGKHKLDNSDQLVPRPILACSSASRIGRCGSVDSEEDGDFEPMTRPLGSFTRRKLELASKWKQLDAHKKRNISGEPCPAPPGAMVLHSHRHYSCPTWCCIPIDITSLSRVGLVKLACAVIFQSAPLQSFASPKRMPRASTGHARVCSFASSTAMGFAVMSADCTNVYAHSPSPTQPIYIRIDDAYVGSAGSALAMEWKLTACWHYQCSRPCRDTPKPVHCGKSTSIRRSRYRFHHTRSKYLSREDRRECFPFMPTS